MKRIERKAAGLIVILMIAVLVGSAFLCGCGEEISAEKQLTYTAAAVAEGTVGVAYAANVARATGASGITYALKSGSRLPDGLTLSSDGKISGTPTEAANAMKFVVVASADGAAGAEAQFSITIKEAPLDGIGYSGQTLRAATLGEAYSADIATASGAERITYALAAGSSLPAGLTLSESGVISGVPAEASGETEFFVVASADGAASAEAGFRLTVQAPEIAGVYVFEAEWGLSGDDTPNAIHAVGGNASGGGYVDFKVDKMQEGDVNSVVYTLSASRDCFARLDFTVGLREIASSLDRIFDIRVNGNTHTSFTEVPKNNVGETGAANWFAWTEINAGYVELKGGETNSVELICNMDADAFNLDCFSLSVPAGCEIFPFDCTVNYSGNDVIATQGIDGLDTSGIAAAFGEGYEISAIQDMNGFAGRELGVGRLDVAGAENDVALGRYQWKVTARKGEKTETMILPVVVAAANVMTYEAEWALCEEGSYVRCQTPKNNPSGSGFASFEAVNASVLFRFHAHEAGKARLTLGIGLRFGERVGLGDVFRISVNGTDLDLGGVYLPALTGVAWYDWTPVTVGDIDVKAEENTVAVTLIDQDKAHTLDYMQLLLPSTQTVLPYGVTEMYEGEEILLKASVAAAECPVVVTSVDTDALETAFGAEASLEAIYDMDEFVGGNMAASRTNILDDLTSQTPGNRSWMVTAAVGTETKTMIVPVCIGSNMPFFEAESGVIVKGSEDNMPGIVSGNNATGVDFHSKNGSVKLTFTASADTDEAVLFVNLGRRDAEQRLADTYSIKVNGEEISVDESVTVSRCGGNNWYDWYSVRVGTVSLCADKENTVEIVGGASALILNGIYVWAPVGTTLEQIIL